MIRVFAFIILISCIAGAYAAVTDTGMDTCLKHHSQETCLNELQ